APVAWPYAIDVGEPSIRKARDEERIAAAFGIATFSLSAADQGLAMLELRVHYEDGLAMWLNGIEVVRSALGRDTTVSLAGRQHGPEWETFYVPVAPGLLRLG